MQPSPALPDEQSWKKMDEGQVYMPAVMSLSTGIASSPAAFSLGDSLPRAMSQWSTLMVVVVVVVVVVIKLTVLSVEYGGASLSLLIQKPTG